MSLFIVSQEYSLNRNLFYHIDEQKPLNTNINVLFRGSERYIGSL